MWPLQNTPSRGGMCGAGIIISMLMDGFDAERVVAIFAQR